MPHGRRSDPTICGHASASWLPAKIPSDYLISRVRGTRWYLGTSQPVWWQRRQLQGYRWAFCLQPQRLSTSYGACSCSRGLSTCRPLFRPGHTASSCQRSSHWPAGLPPRACTTIGVPACSSGWSCSVTRSWISSRIPCGHQRSQTCPCCPLGHQWGVWVCRGRVAEGSQASCRCSRSVL